MTAEEVNLGVLFHGLHSSRLSDADCRQLERLHLAGCVVGELLLTSDNESPPLQAAGPVREECPFLLPLRCPQTTLSAALANLAHTHPLWHPLWPRHRDSAVLVSLQSSASEQDEVARLGWREVNLPTSTASPTLLDELYPGLIRAFLPAGAVGSPQLQVVWVGYHVKWTREKDFLKRGAFPFRPTSNSLCFFPLDPIRPIPHPPHPLHVALLKPTDQIEGMEEGAAGRGGLRDRLRFSDHMCELLSHLALHPSVCVVDPLPAVLKVVDRFEIQSLLAALPPHTRMRAPKAAQVASLEVAHVEAAMREGGVGFPVIIKPQIACGTEEAHKMAVVFRSEGLKDLDVALPAIVQEYVEHGSVEHKCYLIGDRLFTTPRRSPPARPNPIDHSPPPAHAFHSLRTLPLSFGEEESGGGGLDVAAVAEGGRWLKERLGLTLIGFDVVVQHDTGDHVVIDVNFFPSFKEVPNDAALPALWDAISDAYDKHRLGVEEE